MAISIMTTDSVTSLHPKYSTCILSSCRLENALKKPSVEHGLPLERDGFVSRQAQWPLHNSYNSYLSTVTLKIKNKEKEQKQFIQSSRRCHRQAGRTEMLNNLLRWRTPVDAPDMELGHWVTGSMGHLGHLSRPGHRVTWSSF